MPRRTLKALAIPSLASGEWWDTVAPGLHLRVGEKRKTWAVRHTVGGVKRRDTIGHFPAVGLAEARRLAGELLQRVEAGAPIAAPQPHPRRENILTLGEILDRYEAVRRREGKRIKSLAAAMRLLRRDLAAWLALPATSFGKADIRAARDRLAGRGHDAAAALLLRTLGPVMRWAAQEDLIETNHVPAVRKPAVRSRERVLKAAEIARIWRACDTLDSESGRAFGRLVKFLLVTGQRREEAALLRRRDIVAGSWRQKDNKSGRPHAVPLSGLALSLIGVGDNPDALVFRGRTGKLSGFSKLKAALDHSSGVTGWRLHDLRRTAATGMQDLGILRETVDAVLNHAVPGVSGVYMRGQLERQKREALDRWAEQLETIVGLTATEAVA